MSRPVASTDSMGSADATLFARNATGLVRSVNGRVAIALNAIAGTPAYGLSVGILFALSGFPNGNFFLGILLSIPLALAFSYAFGLLSAVIPRSGGDYMVVSRILGPQVGVISTCCMALAQLLSIASVVIFMVKLGVAPGLQTIGLVGQSSTLVDWGNTLTTNQGWQFAVATAVTLAVALIASNGWTWLRRFLMWSFGLSLAGLLVSMIVALLTSKDTFVSQFNAFAVHYTGTSDTYHSIIQTATKNGIQTGGGFSLGDSIALIGVTASFSIYAWNTAFVAGEIREGSTVKTGHRMAIGGVLSLVALGACLAIAFNGWGRDFLTAGYSGAWPASLGSLPMYFVLTSFQLNNLLVAVVLSLAFFLVMPNLAGTLIFVMSRVVFAWGFDGLMPRAVTRVNDRNAPIVAIWILTLGTIPFIAWGVFLAQSLIQIAVYITLIQLIAMGLVGLSAIALPYRRPELYRASSSNARILGVPVVVIAGGGAILSTVLVWYLYFAYPFYGLADKGRFFFWVVGTIIVAIAFYYGASWIRSRQGFNLALVYQEIPPE